MSTAALLAVATTWKRPRRPSVDGEGAVYSTVEHYYTFNRKGLLQRVPTWTQREVVTLSAVSQPQNGHCVLPLLGGSGSSGSLRSREWDGGGSRRGEGAAVQAPFPPVRRFGCTRRVRSCEPLPHVLSTVPSSVLSV